MNLFVDLRTHLLAECKEDEVGLWYIIKNVRRDLKLKDAAEVRRITLELIKELLESGNVQAGYYAPDESGFEPWSIPVDEIIRRINEAWNKLGREPNIGDIVIFRSE